MLPEDAISACHTDSSGCPVRFNGYNDFVAGHLASRHRWRASCPASLARERRIDVMREGRTNLGKKEQRQINQVLTKAMQGDETKMRAMERGLINKQHRIKGRTKS
jgi:hypothetical protein